MNRIRVILLAAMMAPGALADSGSDAAQRRNRILAAAARGEAGFPELIRALEDEHPLVRRAAARALAEIGQPAHAALRKAYADTDPQVRRTAVMTLGALDLDWLETVLLNDPDPSVLESAVQILARMEPRTDRVRQILQTAVRDGTPAVRKIVTETILLRDPGRALLRERPDMADHLPRIYASASLPLPLEGWLFRKDLALQGIDDSWFDPDAPAEGWSPAAIGKAWEDGYDGVGWYRLDFDLPARPDHLAAELFFEGVDEMAWVWVNGIYAGRHDIGPAGWNQPFRLDVTPDLRWNARNRIVVRVLDTAFAGGIWKPVTLEILNMK